MIGRASRTSNKDLGQKNVLQAIAKMVAFVYRPPLLAVKIQDAFANLGLLGKHVLFLFQVVQKTHVENLPILTFKNLSVRMTNLVVLDTNVTVELKSLAMVEGIAK